jgi:hypothetical protein
MNFEDLKLYLPKYLSDDSQKKLFSGLKDFPDNLDSRFYTTKLRGEPVIFQGDGIDNLIVLRLPDITKKEKACIVLSNTCDIDPNNKRNFPAQIVYSPIISLNDYIRKVLSKTNKSENQKEDHLKDIRSQRITQIFYLPEIQGTLDESIVFLDRIYNVDNSFVDRDTLDQQRLFSLSDYGAYLFLFKLSIHFTRIQDNVDRNSN